MKTLKFLFQQRSFLMGAAIAVVAGASQSARADLIPYPDSGSPNAVNYTFTATTSGSITAYFGGSGAGYELLLGMLVNGVSTGVFGLNDHTSSVGDSLNLASGDC